MSRNSDAAWEQYGSQDPYYGVLTDERFQGKVLSPSAHADFFGSGEIHIAEVLDTVRRTLDPDFTPIRALDFGCGTGRLVIPLAGICEVLGVDVSESALREARVNCERQGVEANFAISDDTLSQVDGSFDLIHSFIVFQHIPTDRGMRILDAALDRLASGGVGALHFTYASTAAPWRRWLLRARTSVPALHGALNILRGRPFSAPMMQMNNYDLARILRTIHDRGSRDIHIELTQHGVYLGAFLFFRAGQTPRQ